jgi:transposase
MVQSPMPSLPIERGLPGAGFWRTSWSANIAIISRSIGSPAREGVDLDRAIMAAWVSKVTALAAPLVEAAADHVMTAEKLHADDTPVPVLAPGTGKTKTGRLWCSAASPITRSTASPGWCPGTSTLHRRFAPQPDQRLPVKQK